MLHPTIQILIEETFVARLNQITKFGWYTQRQWMQRIRKKKVILLFIFQIDKIISILISKYNINNRFNFTNITDTLRPSAISTRCHDAGPKISENFWDQKRATTYVFVQKVPHRRFFVRNLCPRNFQKFETEKICGSPKFAEILGQKKKLRFSLIFMSRGFPCRGPVRATFWKDAWQLGDEAAVGYPCGWLANRRRG